MAKQDNHPLHWDKCNPLRAKNGGSITHGHATGVVGNMVVSGGTMLQISRRV